MTPERLRELLEYNPETGELTWKRRDSVQWNGQFAGKRALAGQDKDGYLKGGILYRTFKTHRVVWAIHYGEWPNVIDHINGDVTDNRIANLRSVDDRESKRNLPRQRRNRSGVLGVFPDGNRWRASISVGGKTKMIGRYATVEEATAARRRAEQELGFHENHGREPRTSTV